MNNNGARYGYFLSSEEYGPTNLVEQAVMAEEAGFESLWSPPAPCCAGTTGSPSVWAAGRT